MPLRKKKPFKISGFGFEVFLADEKGKEAHEARKRCTSTYFQ